MLVSRSEHINCEGYICGGIQIRYVLDLHGKIQSSQGERYYRFGLLDGLPAGQRKRRESFGAAQGSVEKEVDFQVRAELIKK